MHPKYPLLMALHKGFTLLETVIGIVVLAISFSILTSLIYPFSEKSAEQIHQVKAAELAQSIMNEIQNKAFDENSDMAGGRERCGESLAPLCSTIMGPETGEVRETFDDVDDYHELELTSNDGKIRNSQGQSLDEYDGYAMKVMVCNDSNYDGTCDANTSTAKLIYVQVTTPMDFTLDFSTYRANF